MLENSAISNLLLWCIVTSFFVLVNGEKDLIDPDAFRLTPDVIRSRGFHVEEHFVVTRDNYVLGLHRIVHPKYATGQRLRPVLLQHGFLASSLAWVVAAPGHLDEDLDYIEPHYHERPTRKLNKRNFPVGNTVCCFVNLICLTTN